MASRRGRPSSAEREQVLKQGASEITQSFLSRPLRQPVDLGFEPYYQRVLKGDLSAILEYLDAGDASVSSDGSFHELIGRLVSMRSSRAAKQIVSDFARRLDPETLPVEANYAYWYRKLGVACTRARAFIAEQYRDNASVKRVHLWPRYIKECYWDRREISEVTRSQRIKSLNSLALPLCDLLDRFSRHYLVPKSVFMELAESDRRDPGRDKRRRERRLRRTPSFVARKYACEMACVSTGFISHKNRSK